MTADDTAHPVSYCEQMVAEAEQEFGPEDIRLRSACAGQQTP